MPAMLILHKTKLELVLHQYLTKNTARERWFWAGIDTKHSKYSSNSGAKYSMTVGSPSACHGYQP